MKTTVLRIPIVSNTKKNISPYPIYLCSDEEYGFSKQYHDEKESFAEKAILNKNDCKNNEIDM
jgi:hypothetical protein